MAFAIPARRAAQPKPAQAPVAAPAVQAPAPSVMQAPAQSPMQQAAMGSQRAPGPRPAVAGGANLAPGVGAPASGRRGMMGLPSGAPRTPAGPAAPAPGSSAAVEAAGDAETEQLLKDMYALNDQTGADIKQAGQDRFGAMQRAAMAASSRFGGGVGGAVLSTQGDMLQQANRGIADALMANSGQRQQIMGNALNMKHGDYRDDLGYARGLEGKIADEEATALGDTKAADSKKAASIAATQIEQQTGQKPGAFTDSTLAGLYEDVVNGKEGAQQALDKYLGEKQVEYEEFLMGDRSSLSSDQKKQLAKLLKNDPALQEAYKQKHGSAELYAALMGDQDD